MFILAVDTTTPAGSTALLLNDRLLGEINVDSTGTHSEKLLPSIHFLLQSFGKNIQDIDAYSIAVGPGSFTGIRIGISLIKSLSYASEKPVAPIPTLKAMALKMSRSSGRLFCPLLDARKSEVYSALFEKRSKSIPIRELVSQGVYSPDALFSCLPSHRIITFMGSGVDLYQKKILDYFRDKARFSLLSSFIAFEVGLLGYDLLRQNKGLNFLELEPLYLRRSQAEENHKHE